MGTSRFGVGLLERDRLKEAKNGEAMASANLGLFSTKSIDGTYTAAYDYMTRFNRTYTEFKKILASSGNAGDIIKIDLSDTEPAVVIEAGKSYTAADEPISTNKLSFLHFYFDIDVIDKENGVPVPIIVPSINMALTIAKNIETETGSTISFTDTPISKINSKVITPDYTGYETSSDTIKHELTLDSFSINLPAGFSADNYALILHALLVAFKEVN